MTKYLIRAAVQFATLISILLLSALAFEYALSPAKPDRGFLPVENRDGLLADFKVIEIGDYNPAAHGVNLVVIEYDLFGFGPPAEAPPAKRVDVKSKPFHGYILTADGSRGSGTYVYDDGYLGGVLTAAHLFRDSQKGITVIFPGFGTFPGKLVAIDRHHDIAVVALDSVGIEPATLAKGKRFGEFTAYGYGGDLTFRGSTGKLIGRAFAPNTTYASAVIDAPVRFGDSGGGVFNDEGDLAGILWGCDDRKRTYFSSITDHRAWVDEALKRIDNAKPVADSLVVVSSENCAPCAQLRPILDELREAGYAVQEVIGETRHGALQISSYPTLIFYRGGKLVGRVTGFRSRESILEVLRRKN